MNTIKREIKFRAWDGSAMHDWQELCCPSHQLSEVFNGDYILMQYTGLKDANGREIYDGDILKLTSEYRGKGERPSYVIFKDSQWMMQGTMHHSHIDSINNYSLDRMDVIGNIYEDPDLL